MMFRSIFALMFAALVTMVPELSAAAERSSASKVQTVFVFSSQYISLSDEDEIVNVVVFGSPEVFVYLAGGSDRCEITCLCGSPQISVTGGDGSDTIHANNYFVGGNSLLDVDEGVGQSVSVFNFFSSVVTDVYITPSDPEPWITDLFSPFAKTSIHRYVP